MGMIPDAWYAKDRGKKSHIEVGAPPTKSDIQRLALHLKTSESADYFQLLTHENYEQRNGIQLEYFYINPMLEILQQTEGLCGHKRRQRL